MHNIVRIATLELKKARKRYSKKSLLVIFIAIFFAMVSSLISLYFGINADAYLYSSASDVLSIRDHRFHHEILDFKNALVKLKNGDLDLFITKGYIIIKGDEKSLSACDEMLKILKTQFEYELYAKYGVSAFPVLIDIKYLKREIATTLSFKQHHEIKQKEKEASKQTEEVVEVHTPSTEEQTPVDTEKKIEEIITEKKTEIPKPKSQEYSIPSKFSPPKLISKIFYGFAFIVPTYFIMQIFSSSLVEDKIARRYDVLISAPIKRYEIILGKLVPYLMLAIVLVCVESLIFSVNAIPFIVPPILFLFFLQSYVALTARSYKEATFLLVAFNMFITAYLFLPAIFSGIPISKVSPITLLLAEMSSEEVAIEDVIFSASQFIIMAVSLLFLSVNMLDIEILYYGSIFDKTFRILSRSLDNCKMVFLASAMSIPFVFIVEFFLIFLFFTLPLDLSISIFLLLIAMVEELAKGMIIASARYNIKASVATALGFFTGEKLLMVASIMKGYQHLFLAQFLILPLILHLITCLTFSIMRGWKGYVSATTLHFIYNYSMVVMLT